MNNKGISLIAVIVAIGFTGILSAAIASIFTTQYRETRALQEKLASLDLEKLVIHSLQDGAVCKYMMNNPSQVKFNSTKPLPFKISPNSPIYANITASTPGPIVAEVGQKVSPNLSSLSIQSIDLELLENVGNTYKARWVIEFDNTSTVRHVKPLYISTIVNADLSSPGAATIDSCQNESEENYGYESGSLFVSGSNKTVLKYTFVSNGQPFVLYYKASASISSNNSSNGLMAGVAIYENNSIIASDYDSFSMSGGGSASAKVNSFTVKEYPADTVLNYELKGSCSPGCSVSGTLYASKL